MLNITIPDRDRIFDSREFLTSRVPDFGVEGVATYVLPLVV